MILEKYRNPNLGDKPKFESWLQHRSLQLPAGYDKMQEEALTSLRPSFVKSLVEGDKLGDDLNKKLVDFEDILLDDLGKLFGRKVVDRLEVDRSDNVLNFADLAEKDIIARLWVNAFDQLAYTERQVHDTWEYSVS